MSKKLELPAEVIEQIREMTANRPQLADAPVEQRMKYFASQLALVIPNVSLVDVQCKSYYNELFQLWSVIFRFAIN